MSAKGLPINVINHIRDILLPIKLPLVIFVGAGVRGKKGFPPTSYEIASHLLDKLDINGKNKRPSLKVSAQYFTMVRRGDEDLLCNTVSEFIKENSPNITNNHQFIVDLVKKQIDCLKQKTKSAHDFDGNDYDEAENTIVIITTNYDVLLERSFLMNELYGFARVIQDFSEEELFLSVFNYNMLSQDDKDKIKSNINNPLVLDSIIASRKLKNCFSSKDFNNKVTNFGKIILYKFHGSIDLPSSCVISEDHYLEFIYKMLKRKFIPDFFRRILTNNPILFIGYSLEDWDFRLVYDFLLREEDKSNKPLKKPKRPSPSRRFAILNPDEPNNGKSQIYLDVQRDFWLKKDVYLCYCDAEEFLNALIRTLIH